MTVSTEKPTDLSRLIITYAKRALVGLTLPKAVVDRLMSNGVFTLGQLYLFDVPDLQTLIGLDGDQIELLQAGLRSAGFEEIPRLKSDSVWVEVAWSWAGQQPATSKTLLVPSGCLTVIPPLWLCSTDVERSVVRCLNSVGLALSVWHMQELSLEVIVNHLTGTGKLTPTVQGADVSEYTPGDILECATNILKYFLDLPSNSFNTQSAGPVTG